MIKLKELLKEDDAVFGTTSVIPLSKVDKDFASDAIGGGLEDKVSTDDKVAGQKAEISVKSLKPAQTEIIPAKATGMAINYLFSGKPDLEDLQAIVSNDNYIMDGHHRWAAATLIDPDKKVKVMAIDLPGKALVTVLNVITVGKLGIDVGNKGAGNVADFKGDKIGEILDGWLQNGMKGEFPKTPDQIKEALGKVPGANGDAMKGKEIMMKNADGLPKQIMPGAPPRVQMPVISPDKVELVKTMLAKGLIDLKTPFSAKVQRDMKAEQALRAAIKPLIKEILKQIK